MKLFKPQKKHSPEINITSLIDIIFILLIFFMVSSTFLRPSIDIKLPVAAYEDTSEREMINVFVGSELEIFIEDEPISLETIQKTLMERTASNPELAIMLYCDSTLTFDNVVKVMDIFKKSGVKNVAIATSGDSETN